MNQHVGASSATVALVLQDPSSLSPDARTLRRARLGPAHRAVGIDSKYLQLPQDQHLWFVHVVLNLAVHAGGLGFTRHLHEYALGATAAEAELAVHAHFAAVVPEAAVIQAKARRSTAEHPEELTFPERVRRADMPATPLARTRPS